MVLDIDAAADVDVEGHMLAVFLHLCHHGEQGAVATARIHLFPFEELAILDALLEIFHREEIILAAIHFLATGRTCGGRHREGHLRDVGHDMIQQGGFART